MENKAKSFDKNKGITLIALVITIIVLLILAGVALATLSGEGSIIKNAEDAVAKYNNSVEKEQMALNNIDKFLQTGDERVVEDDANSTSHGKSTLLWEYEFSEEDKYLDETIETTISIDNLDKYTLLYFIECEDYIDDEGTVIPYASSGELKNHIPVDLLKNEENRYFGDYDSQIKYNNNNLIIKYKNLMSNYDNINPDIIKHQLVKYKLYGVE